MNELKDMNEVNKAFNLKKRVKTPLIPNKATIDF